MRALLALVSILVIAIVVVTQSAFIVDQTQYAVVTRFGQIQRVITNPGLQFKSPFVENVAHFDNRLLRIDTPSEAMQDKDKQLLDIDAYIRYRIVDPRKFLLTLGDKLTAESRISNIVVSELRGDVAQSDRTDIIGGVTSVVSGTIAVLPKRTTDGVDTREALTRKVIRQANLAMQSSATNDFGVEIVDVRIKAADFPTSVEQSVFNRMRTERSVQAQRLRAEGEQQNLTITADVDRQVTIIGAEAVKTANQLKGEGEGQAIAIFASALKQDPEFYAFQRSLQAYEAFLTTNTTVVLSSQDDLFKYLTSPDAPKP